MSYSLGKLQNSNNFKKMEKAKLKSTTSRAVVAHSFNLSTREAEAGGSLWVWGQPGLQELVPGQLGLLNRETLSRKTKKSTTKLKYSNFI